MIIHFTMTLYTMRRIQLIVGLRSSNSSQMLISQNRLFDWLVSQQRKLGWIQNNEKSNKCHYHNQLSNRIGQECQSSQQGSISEASSQRFDRVMLRRSYHAHNLVSEIWLVRVVGLVEPAHQARQVQVSKERKQFLRSARKGKESQL